METINQRHYSDPPMIINESEAHMALVFLLDTSGSMGQKPRKEGELRPIQSLNEGLNRFKNEVCKDEQTKAILDVAIIEFNSDFRVVQDFVPIEYMNPVELSARGLTTMSPAINEALEMVNNRSRFYRICGAQAYKPWVLLISDGGPTDDISAVVEKIKEMEELEKVSFRSLGVGGYSSEALHKLSGPKVMKLEGTDFTHFFDWVNKSMRSISQSVPGEKAKPVDLEGDVKVDIERNTDWD